MSFSDELQATIQHLAAAAGPAVVGIGSRQRGSGVVIDAGRILTNAHNLRGETVTVHFADGRSLRAQVAGVDPDGDLAVIATDMAGVTVLPWADAAPALGATVFGVAAVASGGTRVTFGTVSAIERPFRGPGGRRIAGSIEHTAPLAPGSSGGPLLDAAGHLVGLNTNRLGEGFYLAMPADAALRARVDALGRGESVERRRLGVVIAPAYVARRLRRSVGLPERDGLLVRGVEEGSAAAGAGIRQGDLILAVAGRPVADPDDLLDAIAAAGAAYEVQLLRGADELTVQVRAMADSAGT